MRLVIKIIFNKSGCCEQEELWIDGKREELIIPYENTLSFDTVAKLMERAYDEGWNDKEEDSDGEYVMGKDYSKRDKTLETSGNKLGHFEVKCVEEVNDG